MRSTLFALASLVAAAAALPAQNQSLVLTNGVDGYVEVATAPTLMPASGLTVEAWVTYDSSLGSGWRFPTIVRMDPSSSQTPYFLRVEAGQTMTNRLLWWVQTSNGTFNANWFFPAGTLANWTHLAGTYDGAAIRIFANGVEVATAPATGTLLATNGVFRIGSGDLTISGGETWNGAIDEVRVWPFARDAAAITSTMDLRLASIPGEVSTWNLDGDATDSSGANVGAMVGSTAFAASTRPETALPFNGLLPFGSASGCQSGAVCAATAPATVGNAGFAYVGFRSAGSPLGLAVVGLTALPAPFPVLGIDVHVDPTSGVLLTALPAATGTAHVPLPIPNDPSLPGFALHTQFAWLDATCAGGFSASNALTSIIVP